MSTGEEIYRIENLLKSYGESSAYSEVVKEISLNIYSGEYLVILGPSGSGKSTLLYLLAGLEKPSSGHIYLRNEDLTSFSNNQLARAHRQTIGIVYQSFHLLPSFTILENVSFPLALHGLRLKKRLERGLEVLAHFGIDSLADHYPAQVSGGQQQKAAIARAMINTPSILLVDEPTGNLDTESAQEVMDILEQLHQQGHRTIILVSHNPEFVKYATRTIHIVDGKIYKKPTDIPTTSYPDSTEINLPEIELMKKLKQAKEVGLVNPFSKN